MDKVRVREAADPRRQAAQAGRKPMLLKHLKLLRDCLVL